MPRGKTAELLAFIDACVAILEEIQPASVRAVAYQLFVRHLIDSMSKANTNKVSRELVYAREHGIVPWEWIVDGTRREQRALVWKDLDQCLRVIRANYRRDFWLAQPIRVGIWSEKETVSGTLQPVLNEYQVPYLFTHGHNSGTRTHNAAEIQQGDTRKWIVLYVGDWDPSGMDMSERDLPARLARYGADIELQRLAIRADDLRTLLTFDSRDKEVAAEAKYGPGTKKGKDTRRPWFEATYGRTCCELDAMNPNDLRARVEEAIKWYIDWPAWEHMQLIEQAEIESFTTIRQTWR